eukprot:TRINITY_DN7567_c1_g1_i1.p1 TRINITY_DN7567_c1_g1~~TRINITY_DN7567_c1_g1_i1.p1  ORF type:complete len:731 (-),score=102.31 TRINITY_DN7567_c1_g1_i1:284-2281(-)
MPAYSTGLLSLHDCDISSEAALDEILLGCHGLIHAAADPDVPLERRPEEYGRSSQRILDSVKRCSSITRVIYVSSAAAIMGDTDLHELKARPLMNETRYPDVHSTHDLNGYVLGKLQSEHLFAEGAKATGGRFDVVITNPSDNIGPILSKSHASVRKAWTPWHCTVAEIISKGTFSQSYAYRPWWIVDVRDTAEIHVRLLESNISGLQADAHGNRFFLCSAESIRVEDLGAAIARLLPEIDLDPEDITCHSNRAQEDLVHSFGLTESEMRKIWMGCQLCNEKVCAALGFAFRPLDVSLLDCVASLMSVAGMRPRQNKTAKKNKRFHSSQSLDAAVVRAATVEEIPVIDVSDLISGKPGAVSEIATSIRHACLGTGFFYVANHGLEEHLAVLLRIMREYFNSAEEVKAACSVDKYQRGYRGQGCDQAPGRLPDCKESFDMGVDVPLSHPAVLAGTPMHGPNQWPKNFPELRVPAENYFAACEHLGRMLLAGVACSLGQPDDFFEPYCSEAMVQMRMFHYPPPPDEQGVYGSSPHTDYGMITVLAQDPVGGLEVQLLNGEWVSAPYIEGTLVINIGDMLARWTNDTYHSTMHRVVNRARTDRYSVAMFYHLEASAIVKTIDTCIAKDKPEKYEPIKYLTHIVKRFEEVLQAKFSDNQYNLQQLIAGA